jgi:hypothetical protein
LSDLRFRRARSPARGRVFPPNGGDLRQSAASHSGTVADDFANGIIVKQIIELAKAGDNPDQLCEGALNKLREHLFGD